MHRISVLFWFLSIIISIEGIFYPQLFISRSSPKEKYLSQPLDHFDVNNRRTWWMRFYENTEFFHRNGPIFIIIGGEWTITSNYVESGFVYDNARIQGAMIYYIEHRYYGKSYPVPDLSYENLKYLKVEQALADIAYFIGITKKQLDSPNSRIVVFGNSYAGNLAAWMRVRYPQLVQGAVASSAPVYAKADFSEFYQVVASSLRKYNNRCVENIKNAFRVVEDLLSGTQHDTMQLRKDFKLCNESDIYLPADHAFIIHGIASIFRDAVLQNSIEANGKTSIANLCDWMIEDRTNTTPYQKLAEIYKKTYDIYSCIPLDYTKFIKDNSVVSWTSGTAYMRTWLYQTCTEFGYHQTSSSPESIFGSLFPLDYFMKMCRALFGKKYNETVLKRSIEKKNLIYNSKLSRVKNLIFTNGDLDPWYPLSILTDLNPDSPSIMINGTTHSASLSQMRDVEFLQ